MKYVIVSFLILCFSILVPVNAREISADSYVINYEPLETYKVKSRYIEQPVKSRMPLDHTELSAKTSTYIAQVNEEPHIWIKTFIIPLIIQDVIIRASKAWNNAKENLIKTLSTAIARIEKPIKKPLIVKSLNNKPNIDTIETQFYSFNELPQLGEVNGVHSKFIGNPYGPEIPEKMQQVYTWDRLWNPAYNPQHYLQCTTFVAMIYNLNGISLHGKVYGDAKDWITFTDIFVVYENGKTTERPKVMDIVVWASGEDNHVGVVSAVSDSKIIVINANATVSKYEYTLSVNDEGIVRLIGSSSWLPSHWMRIKK